MLCYVIGPLSHFIILYLCPLSHFITLYLHQLSPFNMLCYVIGQLSPFIILCLGPLSHFNMLCLGPLSHFNILCLSQLSPFRDHSENISWELRLFGGCPNVAIHWSGGPDFANRLREVLRFHQILIIMKTKIAQIRPKNT